MSGNAWQTHPSRPTRSGPALYSADHPSIVEQCNKDVTPREHPKRDDQTGIGVWSKEDVHDQRTPLSMGVFTSHGLVKNSISLFIVSMEWTAIRFAPVSFSKRGRGRRLDLARGARSGEVGLRVRVTLALFYKKTAFYRPNKAFDWSILTSRDFL